MTFFRQEIKILMKMWRIWKFMWRIAWEIMIWELLIKFLKFLEIVLIDQSFWLLNKKMNCWQIFLLYFEFQMNFHLLFYLKTEWYSRWNLVKLSQRSFNLKPHSNLRFSTVFISNFVHPTPFNQFYFKRLAFNLHESPANPHKSCHPPIKNKKHRSST